MRLRRRLLIQLHLIRSCSRWGLPGTKSPAFLGVSYTSVPPLPVPLRERPSAVHFCGTILRLAPTGRYPASCLMEPGLSSRDVFTSPAIVCQTFRTTLYIIQTSHVWHKHYSLVIYRNLNGSVFTCDANTPVSYLCSFSFPDIHSATFSFMIFSALCPGSIREIPARCASCAVW